MENVIIIGTGCAGYTAAIYTARASLSPLLLSGTQPGGQLTTTTEVENFPGHPDGIMGPDLMAELRVQATRFGAEIVQGDVSEVDLSARPFRLQVSPTSEGHWVHAADPVPAEDAPGHLELWHTRLDTGHRETVTDQHRAGAHFRLRLFPQRRHGRR